MENSHFWKENALKFVSLGPWVFSIVVFMKGVDRGTANKVGIELSTIRTHLEKDYI
jgi:hypothetical protein